MVKSVRNSNVLFSLFCVLSLTLLFSPIFVTVAGASDGETPAEEDVCDGLTGDAYGLCNAYCEAMDCNKYPVMSQQACDTVKAIFVQHTGNAFLPCENYSDTYVMNNRLRSRRVREVC